MNPLQTGYVKLKSKIFGLWSHTIKIINKLYKLHVLCCAIMVGFIARGQRWLLWIPGREINDGIKVLKRKGCMLGKMCEEILIEEGVSKQRDIQTA